MTPRVSSSPAAVRALRRVYRHPPNAAYRPLTVPRNGTSGKETRADHDFARGSLNLVNIIMVMTENDRGRLLLKGRTFLGPDRSVAPASGLPAWIAVKGP